MEINEGRGCGPNKDHVYLYLNHLPPEACAHTITTAPPSPSHPAPSRVYPCFLCLLPPPLPPPARALSSPRR
eukprot:6175742-Pleurochrysis_carterae.AAC.2